MMGWCVDTLPAGIYPTKTGENARMANIKDAVELIHGIFWIGL